MNKSELIERIAIDADLSKASAARALDAALRAIRFTLRKGGEVRLVGFGTFRVTKRAARKGVNPRTGEPLKIRAAKVPKFTPGQPLKDFLN